MDALTLFDGHVHVHKHTDVAALLSAAAENFAAAAAKLTAGSWRGVLLLTEMGHRDWFAQTATRQEHAELGSWRILSSGPSAINLRAARQIGQGAVTELTIVAGSQIITSERIEVLALGTRTRISDGAPLEPTIAMAQEAGALVVLPWGAGKWLGHRGRLVQQALAASRNQQIFAGDNRGRPACFGQPAAFSIARWRGTAVLPGTDPLALFGEEKHVGSFGFAISGIVPEPIDGVGLHQAISRGSAGVRSYGGHVGPIRFIRNQVALRIKKERYP